MTKFYATIATLAAGMALAASLAARPAAQLAGITPKATSEILTQRAYQPVPGQPKKSPRTADDTEWGEWTDAGTASFPQQTIDTWTSQLDADGAIFPTFTQPFAVERRQSVSAPENGELRLRGVFGGVDFVIPYDARTGYFNTDPVSTGIPIPHNSYYENYMLSLTGFYYPSSQTIDIKSGFLYTNNEWGFNVIPFRIVGEEAPVVEFSLASDFFIPSTATEATVNVSRTPNVAWYRVASAENSPYLRDWAYYLEKEPRYAPSPYTDYVSPDVFKVSPHGMSALASTYFAVPFGTDDKAIAPYALTNVFYNYNFHNGYNADWQQLGQGRMVENAVYYGFTSDAYQAIVVDGVPVETPCVSTPEVEMTADRSLVCVRNPFGSRHPAYDKIPENCPAAKADDFYMVFDISDPERVYVLETLTGMPYENRAAGLRQIQFASPAREMLDNGSTQDDIDNHPETLWGKFADNRIIMPTGTLGIGNTYSTNCELSLELPGYVDYDITAEGTFSVGNGSYRFPLTYVSPNVTSVDYALVPTSLYDAEHNFPERLAKRIAERDQAFTIYSAPTNGSAVMTLTIPDEAVPYGSFTLVATGRDSQGGFHRAAVVKNVNKSRSLDQWRAAGIIPVRDNTLAELFTSRMGAEFKVEALENPDVPGVYLLVDYYKKLISFYGYDDKFDPTDADPYVLDLRGEYPFVTNDLSGAKFTDKMHMGITLPVNETLSYVPFLMNTRDYNFHGVRYGTIQRGDDGSIQSVDLSNSMVCILFNGVANSGYGSWEVTECVFDFTYDPDKDPLIFDNWIPLGKAEITETILSDVIVKDGETTCEADIFAHPTIDGIYCLDKIFKNTGWERVKDWSFKDYGWPFVINATDPSKVHVSPDFSCERTGVTFFTGWQQADTPLFLCMMANAIDEGAFSGNPDPDDYVGSYDAAAGEFNLDKCFMAFFGQRLIESPANPRFRVKFIPASVDEADVAEAEVVAVEYYSVDGRRLSAPAEGSMTIRRRVFSDGTAATDKLFR